MKKLRFVSIVLAVATVLLSACGAAAATPSVGAVAPKVDAVPVAFIGTINSMAGDQWVINGTTITVAAAVVRDGPFNVGDQVKVEGAVSPDGSFAVSRVEPPTATDLSSLPSFGGTDNSNSNTNDANVNDSNTNAANVNDDNSNSANTNDGNVNDDNGNGANSNDDNSNSANSNDDNGNDDNGNDANSNDDNGGGSNSNDDDGNDNSSGGGDDNSGNGGGDNSGSGGGDDSGGEDNSGGGGNDD
jgi:uncharacterized membrane protein YgcG